MFLRAVCDLTNALPAETILVTHLLQIVLNTASTILLIEDGRVLYGEADEVLQEDKLSELYRTRVRLGTVAGRRTLVVGGSSG